MPNTCECMSAYRVEQAWHIAKYAHACNSVTYVGQVFSWLFKYIASDSVALVGAEDELLISCMKNVLKTLRWIRNKSRFLIHGLTCTYAAQVWGYVPHLFEVFDMHRKFPHCEGHAWLHIEVRPPPTITVTLIKRHGLNRITRECPVRASKVKIKRPLWRV